MVSILLRVIMGKGSEQNMYPDHTYSNHCMTTQSPADGAVFNLRTSGCPVPAVELAKGWLTRYPA